MAKTLISTPLNITTSDTAVGEVDVTSGIDGTYPVYEFHFVNLHPENTGVFFGFQVNAGDTGWNDSPITSTHVQNYQDEDDSAHAVHYSDSHDSGAISASFTKLFNGQVNDTDSSASGIFTLYGPSSTTFVKQWIGRFSFHNSSGPHYATEAFTGGYVDDTDAVTQIRFMFDSGDIDAGTIKMFGVS